MVDNFFLKEAKIIDNSEGVIRLVELLPKFIQRLKLDDALILVKVD